MWMTWLQHEVSIDDSMGHRSGRSLHGRLVDPAAESQEQAMYRKELAVLIRKALLNLDVRERHIIEHHFGLSGGKERSLDDIAAGLSVSRERVRQLECRAKTKLRKDLTGCSPSEVGSWRRSTTACCPSR